MFVSKEWSVLGILEFARPKLSVDTIKESKEDLYAILQKYSEKNNVHAYAKNKTKKILTNFDAHFSTVEVRKFIYDLEFHAEVRVNVTSAYTVEVLKDQQENRKRINQLRNDNISSVNSNLEDGQEHPVRVVSEGVQASSHQHRSDFNDDQEDQEDQEVNDAEIDKIVVNKSDNWNVTRRI